jgi:hypothetical protein
LFHPSTKEQTFRDEERQRYFLRGGSAASLDRLRQRGGERQRAVVSIFTLSVTSRRREELKTTLPRHNHASLLPPLTHSSESRDREREREAPSSRRRGEGGRRSKSTHQTLHRAEREGWRERRVLARQTK